MLGERFLLLFKGMRVGFLSKLYLVRNNNSNRGNDSNSS